ncbi:MAG: hypothetical protein HC866_21210 [Leptolyngbyaceae cyanobacterium RU_5_1]|nr:hypothetical protein [Leptolyngbyaceae cyanobacterium RU_5_1]
MIAFTSLRLYGQQRDRVSRSLDANRLINTNLLLDYAPFAEPAYVPGLLTDSRPSTHAR